MSDAHDRWAVGNSTEVGTLGALYKQKALNDGPEALAFIDAATSPIASTPMLLAVSPLSGRLSAYEIVESSALRTNDGSCPSTAGCDYLPTTVGGTGLLVSNKKVGGLSTYDPTAYTVPVPVFAVIGFFGAVIVIGLLAPATNSFVLATAPVRSCCAGRRRFCCRLVCLLHRCRRCNITVVVRFVFNV